MAARTPVLIALLILLIAVFAATGCGGGDAAEQQARQEGPQLAEPINLANCDDWNAGTVQERLGTIRRIGDFLGTPIPETSESRQTLDTENAYELFEGWCSKDFAHGFRLYKLYARAQAFAGAYGHQPPQ